MISNNQIIRNIIGVNSKNISKFQKFLECLLIPISFYLQVARNNSEELSLNHLSICLLFFTYFALTSTGLYKSFRVRKLHQILFNINFSFFILLCFIFGYSLFFKNLDYFYTSNFHIWVAELYLLLFIDHFLIRIFLRRLRVNGRNDRKFIYVGDESSLIYFLKNINKNPWLGYKISYWTSKDNPKLIGSSMPEWFHISELKSWLKSTKVDKIFFNTSNLSNQEIESLIKIFGDTSIPTVCVPSWANAGMKLSVDYIDDICLIDLWDGERNFLSLFFKRIFDIFISGLIIIFISPILFLISVLIKITSEGPIIFKQERAGQDGKTFFIYKFRSMKVQKQTSEKILKQASKNDPRNTVVGSFLRKWSLDELPQFFNVLQGSMSIVGPRPHAVEHNEYYRKLIPGYMQRHAFKPGITGYAQIMDFRGETKEINDMKKRVEFDLIYQRDWSLVFDIFIIIKTIFKIKSKNSY